MKIKRPAGATPPTSGRTLQYRLDNVPMFSDLAILNPEQIDGRIAARARRTNAVHVKDDNVSISEDAAFGGSMWRLRADR